MVFMDSNPQPVAFNYPNGTTQQAQYVLAVLAGVDRAEISLQVCLPLGTRSLATDRPHTLRQIQEATI